VFHLGPDRATGRTEPNALKARWSCGWKEEPNFHAQLSAMISNAQLDLLIAKLGNLLAKSFFVCLRGSVPRPIKTLMDTGHQQISTLSNVYSLPLVES
jgi:hypothetical protein